ncbi:MAG: phosphatase PAP2 family protein [Candidatus Methanoperedens sp.]|nr:phosphatase PAP2 family protein [Candidatus Methanoperedens sp.]
MLEPVQFLFNDNINIYLQSVGNPSLDVLFKAITTIGSEPSYILLASLIFWCFGKKTGIRAMYVILFSAFAAIFAKNLFAMPRPPEYLHKIQENDFGFPSGHAFVSSGFWGYLGGMIKNYWLISVGAVAILSISLSRIYLGVHYLGDVVGGIIFGLLMALISLKAEPGITSRLEKLGRIPGYFVALMLPVILVAIAIMQHNILIEQEEVGLVMAGIGAGYLLEEERVGFADATNNRQRIKRAVMGIVVLGIIYLISSVLLSINPNFIFFKYAALGFASTFIAPWVITKIEFKNQK